MKMKTLVLVAAVSVVAASPGLAAPAKTGLSIGGDTIAGPGSSTLAPAAVAVIYTNDQGDTDACTTVVNAGRGAVRLTMVGGGTGSIDLAAGTTAALCRDDVSEIELTCLGVAPNSCSAQWRVDRD